MQSHPLTPNDADACESIIRALPAWFGIEEGIAEARHYLETHEGFVAIDDDRPVGFVTFHSDFPESIEISWMAVLPECHRRGIGRRLVDAFLDLAQSRNHRIALVKTLAGTHPSPEYAITRAFYRRMGFLPLTVLPELWDPANPCLLTACPLW